MKRLSFSVFVLFFNFPMLLGQSNYWTQPSPYQLSWKKDLAIGGTALAVYFTGAAVEQNEPTPSFTAGSFTQRDIDNINFLDRGLAWKVGY